MFDFDITAEDAKQLSNDAHRVYLDVWETKTQFAENDCKWNVDIQHRNHEAIENLASAVDILAMTLAQALSHIVVLEKELKTIKK